MLFFSEGDRAKQEFFIQQMTGDARESAERQLQQMVDYGRLQTCRRRYLLAYFGEDMAGDSCGNCDTCAWRNGNRWTLPQWRRKLLSAVIRTGERFGIAHVINVLLGSNMARIRELGHDKLTVYGIVNDYDRNALRDIANALVEQGFLARADGEYPTIRVTPAGREWLRSRRNLTLQLRVDESAPTRERRRERSSNGGSPDYDASLFEQLRALRRRLADAEGVPAFVVFGDATLRGLAKARPVDRHAMLSVSGVGPAKLERYGDAFLTMIGEYVSDKKPNPDESGPSYLDKMQRIKGIRARKDVDKAPMGTTHALTLHLLQQGLSVAEIAKERGLSHGTVLAHLERIVKSGETVDITPLLPSPERVERIRATLEVAGDERLAPVKELLGDDYSYDEIRLVRLAYGDAKT